MTQNSDTLRINSFLSKCGLGSRRSCERFIRNQRVKVNGVLIDSLAHQVNPSQDTVTVDDAPVNIPDKEHHLILNKPAGYIVSRDAQGGRSVFELLKGFPQNLQYAGRLDAESEGLLFFSTNGEIILRLTHPRYKTGKIYLVTTDQVLSEKALDLFRKGVTLEDGITQPAQIDALPASTREYRIILHEGRNRQIRRMMDVLGYKVRKLKRITFGPLNLGHLKCGHFRPLTENELWKLKRNLKLKDKDC